MNVEKSDLIYLAHELHNFNFGKVYFFEHMIISELKEGIVFTYKNALEFISRAENYYGTKRKLVYISNRIYSYSVDPVDWIKLGSNHNNLMAIGVINYTSFKKKVFFVEKLFCRKTMMSFDSLQEAVDWAYELTQINKSKAG